MDDEAWDGEAYPLNHPYIDGEDLTRYYPHWDVTQPDGSSVRLPGPHEFRHTLSTVMNRLVGNGFVFLGLWEWMQDDRESRPGYVVALYQDSPAVVRYVLAATEVKSR